MKVVCILGPTGVGKSDLAVAAAVALGGEVVNADSMQVYRHLEIGTAAPPPEARAAAPHHLFGYLDPDREPDAGRWAREAAAVIGGIAARGALPIVVGGTFFWISALLDGLADIPPVPREVRERVAADLAADGVEALHRRLAAADPETAARLAPGDTQRVCRALEVWLASGTPLSTFHRAPRLPALRADVLRIALDLPRPALYARIDARVGAMLDAGLVGEVRRVLDLGFPPDVRPLRAMSLRPVVDHLLHGLDPAAMREQVAQGHRNYAKRQLTWLKADGRATPFDACDRAAVLEWIASFVRAG